MVAELYERVVAAASSERLAVVSPDGQLTYRELIGRAERLAAGLASRHGPVLVYGHKQPAMVVAFLAALRLGRPYIPVDVSAPLARIARILDLARPAVVVAAQELPPQLAGELTQRGTPIVALDPVGNVGAMTPETSGTRGAVDATRPEVPLAYIMFTSGTTGDPKGVPIPVAALEHFADWLLSLASFTRAGEVWLNQAPFNFDLSVMDLYGSLLTGGTLFCLTRHEIGDPRALFARLTEAPLTAWVSTPSFARYCLAEPRFRANMLPNLRCFLFCGETLPPSVASELLERFPAAVVWNTYGPTETTVAVTGVLIDRARATAGVPLPVGWPAREMAVWIADSADPSRSLPPGTTGEIVIAGPQVSTGYLLAPSADASTDRAAAFFQLPDGRRAYRTGDLGHVDPVDGLLYCGGRVDRQIKLHGYRLELEEIESLLRLVPGIGDAAVFVVERDGYPDHLAAFLVPSGTLEAASLPDDSFELSQTVRRYLAERLPVYALPRSVRLVPTPPLTANGKLDRRALRSLLGR